MFEGGPAWDRIVEREPKWAGIFFWHLMPMLLITAGLEGLGLRHWGKWLSAYRSYKPFSDQTIITYEVAQTVLNLFLILVCARLVRMLGRTFHGRITYTYTRAFATVVYGLSPMFLLRLLDPFPTINPLYTWIPGIMLSIWVLYDGLPRLLQPDPTHALGLYMSSAIVLLLCTGLIRGITGLYLMGNQGFAHSFLGREIIEWLGP
jgi:low affinity Fe/Cu permease